MAESEAGCEQLRYSMKFQPEEYRLMELPDELLNDDGWEGGVFVKGNPGERAVLCTRKRTYAMRFLENSNSLLLLNNSKKEGGDQSDGLSAVADLKGHIIVEITNPRLDRLNEILKANVFKENSTAGGGCSIDEIENKVRASRDEIFEALRDLHGLEVDGKWCGVDPNDEEQILFIISNLMIMKDCPRNRFLGDDMKEWIGDDAPSVLIDHCLNRFFTEVGDGYLDCNTRELASFYAERTFRNAELVMEREEFFSAWKRSIPESFEFPCELSQLAGTVIEQDSSTSTNITSSGQGKQTLQLLLKRDLPSHMEQRIDHLFRIKPTWSRQELENYMDSDLDALLSRSAKLVRGASSGTFYRRKLAAT